jgi:two-component system, NtrC family, sensor histidine kinase HydH
MGLTDRKVGGIKVLGNRPKEKPSLRTVFDLIIIIGSVSLLTGIHYTSYHYSVDYHLILQFGYYIPVIYAAIRFGRVGGIGCGLIIALLFLPFMADYQTHMSREIKYTQWVSILLINGFGWFTGLLVEQERKATRHLEKTLGVKEILVEKLRVEAQERQRLEAQIRRSERLSALGHLSAGLAHEIRNPLGIIRVTTQLLSREKPEDPAISEYCEVLQEETNRLNRLLTDFLNFARPKDPNRDQVRLFELIQEGTNLAKPLFEEVGIVLEQRLNAIAEVWVNVDKDQIKQVILNLLINALEAQSGIEYCKGKIVVEGINKDEGVGFAIIDQGPGIPDGVSTDIFNPFYTTKEKGTGLGLSIVHRILEQHQGNIALTNLPVGGVRAEVLFPSTLDSNLSTVI